MATEGGRGLLWESGRIEYNTDKIFEEIIAKKLGERQIYIFMRLSKLQTGKIQRNPC